VGGSSASATVARGRTPFCTVAMVLSVPSMLLILRILRRFENLTASTIAASMLTDT
jgi:hypothetical protein